MATRKSGDNSRGVGDGSSEHPGSYAKSLGPRRKRKGKSGRSSFPPSSAPPAPGELDALDTVGEEVQAGGRLERTTLPDWGSGAGQDNASDHSVDDLRKRPSSNRAVRRPMGPLGMDEPAAEPSSLPPRRPSTPEPVASGRLNVVEINASERARAAHEQRAREVHEPPRAAQRVAREQHDDRYEPSSNPFGDPFADQAIGSSPPTARTSEQPGAFRAPEPPRAPRPSQQPGAYRGPEQARARSSELPRASRRPSASSQLVLDEGRDDEDLINARPSLSSVFDARASIRPSPPPPKKASSSLGWLLVLALSAIIVAAGVTAYKESKRRHAPVASAPAEPVVAEPVAAPAPVAPTEPAPAPATKQATPKPATAVSKPLVTSAAKPVPTPTPRPVVTPKPVATPRPRPVVTQLQEPKPAAEPAAPRANAAPLVRPVEWEDAPVEHPRHASATAEPAPKPSAEPSAEPAPSEDERLPQNPYR